MENALHLHVRKDTLEVNIVIRENFHSYVLFDFMTVDLLEAEKVIQGNVVLILTDTAAFNAVEVEDKGHL